MKLYWNNSDSEIGSYKLFFMDDDEKIIAEMTLRDYTCEYFQNYGKPRFYEKVNFEYSYCNGFSMHKCIEADITLEQAKTAAENWLINHYIQTYENTKKSLKRLKKQADWLSKYRHEGYGG